MNAYKYQRGEAVGFSMLMLAIFLLITIPYMQGKDDRKNVKELKDGYQAFLAYGEKERLRGLGFDTTLDGVYKGEGRLGGRSASLTYEFKDGVLTKTLETAVTKITGTASFVQNGPEVSYSLIQGYSDLFPSTPEIFVAMPDGRVYSAFTRASMAHTPASQVAAEKDQAESFWLLIKNILGAFILMTVTFIVTAVVMRMRRMRNKPQ